MNKFRALILTCLFLSLNVFAKTPESAPFKKVFIVIFENANEQETLQQSTFGRLVNNSKSAYLYDFHAITHPSQPNYIALTSGDTQGIRDDDNHNINKENIVDLLETKNISWKVYLEDYPGECDPNIKIGKYVRKHNPFISYVNIQKNSNRCKHLVNASQLAKDIANKAVPDFSFYVPNLDNDGHDTGVHYADNWLKNTLIPYLRNPAFMNNMLFVITFDENDHPQTANNHIYTLLYGDMIQKNSEAQHKAYNLYSLLRTIEDAWGLGSLNLHDKTSTPIQGVFKR